MFGRFDVLLDECDFPVDAGVLAEGLRFVDRLVAKLSTLAGECEAAQLWEPEGNTSMPAWLRDKVGMTSRAGAFTRRARRLHQLPVTRRAWECGVLSAGQVDAVVANLNDRRTPLFAEHEAAVVPALAGLSVADTAAAMAHWAQLADDADGGPAPEQPPSSVFLSGTLDGRGELSGSLDAADHAVVAAALRIAEGEDEPGEVRTTAVRKADALRTVCEFFLANHQRPERGRHRPHVNLVFRVENGETTTVDGIRLPPSAARREW